MAQLDKLWFNEAVEGLFVQALGPQLDRGARDRLRDVGLDLDRPLLPAYPAKVWAEAVKVAASVIYPRLDASSGMYQIGVRFSDGYASTIMGKALYGFLKLLGPRRTLPRMGRNFRNVTNYLDVVVTEIQPGCFQARFNDVDGIPYFYKGLVDASGKVLGAPRESSEQITCDGGGLSLFIDIRDVVTTPFPPGSGGGDPRPRAGS